MTPHRSHLSQLIVLQALAAVAALLTAASCQDDPAPVDAEPAPPRAPAEPPWVADAAAPRYTLATGPDGAPRILDAEGQLVFDLGITRLAAYGEAEGEAGCEAEGLCLHTERAALAGWTLTSAEDTYTFKATHSGQHARLEATWRIRRGDPRVHLKLQLTFTTDATPDHEAVALALPPDASLLTPDLRFTRLEGAEAPVRVDRWTPHRAIAGDGVHALHLAAWGFEGATGRRGATPTLELALEDARLHPFRPVAGCGTPGARALARDRAPRKANDTLSAEIDLWIGHTWAPIEHRLPGGREAALALIDQAPTTQPRDELAALLSGHSNPDDPRFGNGGFLGHQLGMTRAMFAGPQGLGDPGAAQVARQSHGLGVRFASLGPSAQRDDEAFVEAGMTSMAPLGPSLWVDPEPGACDGLLDGGWDDALGDLLTKRGYTLALDRSAPEGADLNALTSGRPLLWRVDRGQTHLWLLQAQDLRAPNAWRAVRDEALDQLIRERGLAFLRTHLGTTEHGGGLRREPGGEVVPTGELEKRLFDLADRHERGTLWVAAAEDLARHLTRLEDLRLAPLADGQIAITNPSAEPLAFSVWLPGTRYAALQGEQPLPRRRVDDPDLPATLTWIDLPPHTTTRLHIVDDQGRQLRPLVPVQWTLAEPR